MKVIGLTGSIGMGKSTTSRLFSDLGVPVFDSDACVHALYAPGGAGVAPVSQAFPGVESEGAIDRKKLSAALSRSEDGFERLEKIVHPLVFKAREDFVSKAKAAGADLVVFDIPLLFETGSEAGMDYIIVVSAPDDIRRQRVLAREDMSPAKLEAIIGRQMPDADKRDRADFVIDTSISIDDARHQVIEILKTLRLAAGDENSHA